MRCLFDGGPVNEERSKHRKGMMQKASVLNNQGFSNAMKQETLVDHLPICDTIKSELDDFDECDIHFGCDYEMPIEVEMKVSDNEIEFDGITSRKECLADNKAQTKRLLIDGNAKTIGINNIINLAPKRTKASKVNIELKNFNSKQSSNGKKIEEKNHNRNLSKRKRKTKLSNFSKTPNYHKSKTASKANLKTSNTPTHLNDLNTENTNDLESVSNSKKNSLYRLDMEPNQHKIIDNMLKCSQCNKRFFKQIFLEAHIKGAHEGVERPFACPYCPSTYRIILLLRRHVRNKHPPNDGSSQIKILHDCTFCQRKFTRKDHMKEHIRVVHEGLRPFKCSVCGKTFGSKTAQKRHEQNHSDERPHACEHCNKRYNCEYELKIHLERHTTDPDLLCPICKRSKPNAEELQKHIAMHQSSRQYQCSKCGKIFGKLVHLKEHDSTVHLKLRPFKCCLCGLDFGARKSLKSHERNHDPTGRSEHCTFCQLYFKTKRALALHINKKHRTQTLNNSNKYLCVSLSSTDFKHLI